MQDDNTTAIEADATVGSSTGSDAGDKGAAAASAAVTAGSKTTISTGADNDGAGGDKVDAPADGKPADKAPVKPWGDNWREEMARHASAGDEKVYKKELARLQRIASPEGVYGMYREMESKFTSGGLVKMPGKDAKPEDIAAFHKALGVPEKAEDYFKDLKLENGAEIGEADKPIVGAFADAMHKAGAPPQTMKAALDWYYQHQEQQAAAVDEADDQFRRESERALKEELGAAFKRHTGAIPALFATAPGGADARNENSLLARIMGGRMSDGRIIGDDPDAVRFFISLAQEINPAATVVEDGAGTVQSVGAELDSLRALRSSNPTKYWSAEVQAREAELINAQIKMGKRG